MTRRLALAATLLSATVAHANIAAARPDPAVASGLETEGTALAVTAEDLAVTCVEARGEPACTFTARYTVHNPTDAPQAALAAFASVRAEDVHVLQDGAAIDRELSADERTRLKRGPAPVPDEALSRRGFTLTLAAGASTQLVVTGQLRPGRFFVPSYATSPVETRHPLLGSAGPRSTTFNLDYLVSPLRSWAAQPPVHVAVTLPKTWTTRFHVLSKRDANELKPALDAAGESVTARFTLDGARDDQLQVALELPERVFFNGGVLLGVGGAFDSTQRLRLRAGYQVAAPQWWLYSLVAETDARRELLLVATVEVASPSLLVVIPSASIGLGLPVRVLPDVRAGGRVQLSLHWPFVGVVAALDVFPGAARDVVQFSLLAQLGL